MPRQYDRELTVDGWVVGDPQPTGGGPVEIEDVTGLQAALDAIESAGIADGDKTDITVSASGTAWTIDNDVVSNAKLSNVATSTIKGRATAGTGDPEDLTPTQAKTVLAIAAADVSDFDSASRAQTEAALVAGSGITITPGSSGATRTLTLASTGGAGVTDGDKGDITVSASGATWTIDNSAVTNAKVATGIDAAKLADGTVSNAEFQYLNGVTSALQTQLDAKLAAAIATDITTTKGTPIGADQIILLDSADSDTPKLATITSLPAGAPGDGTITLAKLANLAQDQFIGRTTASTGVPQTATITAAARTVLDDATVAAMVDTLGGASSTGTGGLARATSPTFVTPVLGTPTSGTLTNCTGLPLISIGTALGTSGSVALNFDTLRGTRQSITLTGAITFTTSNLAAGRGLELRLAAGGSTRTITWPAFVAFGAALPTSLASGATLIVSLFANSTTDASVDAVAVVSA